MIEIHWESRPMAGRPISLQDLVLDPDYTLAERLSPEYLAPAPALRQFASAIGGTPLIPLPHEPGSAPIFGKAEFMNIFGTVKARAALALLLDDLRRDQKTPNHQRWYLSYGGSTFHKALVPMVYATGARLTMYGGTFMGADERRQLELKGVEVRLVDKNLGFSAIIEAAVRAAALSPQARFLFQHQDAAALGIHYQTTGNELVNQLSQVGLRAGSRIALVASIGTGGTLIGTARRIKESGFDGLRVFATTPAEQPYADPGPPNGATKFAGSGGLGWGRRQPFVAQAENLVAGHFSVNYSSSLAAGAEFAGLTGLTIGTSAAANWLAARNVAKCLGKDAAVICILPSLMSQSEALLAQETLSRLRQAELSPIC